MTPRSVAAAVKPNWLDRAISHVAPRWAMRRVAGRAAYQAMTGGYKGGRRDRRQTRGWKTETGDADSAILTNLSAIRDRCRDLYRNAPLGTAAIDRRVAGIVGWGLRLESEVDAEFLGLDDKQADALQDAFERDFDLWSSSKECDVTGCQDFNGMLALVQKSIDDGGDVFMVRRTIDEPGRTFQTSMQLFEAEQISNPNNLPDGRRWRSTGNRISGGVESTDLGRVVAYWIQDLHPGNVAGESQRTWTRVPLIGAASGRQQIFHYYDKARIGASRGLPYLAPVIELTKQLGDYTDFELNAALVASLVAVVAKSGSGQGLPPNTPEEAAAVGADLESQEYGMVSGQILEVGEGDDYDVKSLGRPNAQFEPFHVALVRQFAAAIGLPFEVLMMHFTASYSASRAALEMAERGFRRDREALIRGFCADAFGMQAFESVATGRIAAPGFLTDPTFRRAYLGANWIGPPQITVRIDQETKALAEQEDRGWRTKRENTALMTGGNWRRKERQRQREQRIIGGGRPGGDDGTRPPPAQDGNRDDEDPDENGDGGNGGGEDR